MTKAYDVPYMQRTRDYYRAQGYARDYQWARHSHTPFVRPKLPLTDCRLAVITTSMPDTEAGRSERKIYSCPSAPTPDSMYTDELSWHQSVTHTRDVGSFLPLDAARQAVKDRRLGSLSDRFHSLPTEYSQRRSREQDAPELLSRLRQDKADLALLVPL